MRPAGRIRPVAVLWKKSFSIDLLYLLYFGATQVPYLLNQNEVEVDGCLLFVVCKHYGMQGSCALKDSLAKCPILQTLTSTHRHIKNAESVKLTDQLLPIVLILWNHQRLHVLTHLLIIRLFLCPLRHSIGLLVASISQLNHTNRLLCRSARNDIHVQNCLPLDFPALTVSFQVSQINVNE